MKTEFNFGSNYSSNSSMLTSNQRSPALAEAASSSEPLDTIYTSCDDSSDYKQPESRYSLLSHCYQQLDVSQHFELHESDEIVHNTIDHPAEPDVTPASVQVKLSEQSTGSTDDVISASSTLRQHTDVSDVGTHVNSIAALLHEDTQTSACSALSNSVDDWSSRDNNDELSNYHEYQLSDNQGYSSLSHSYQQLLVRHTVECHTAASDHTIGESHQSADSAYLQPLQSTYMTPSKSYLTPIDHPVEPDITSACVQVELSEKSTGSADVINASSTFYQRTDMSVGTHVNSIATPLYEDTQNNADTNQAANVLYESHNNTDGNSHAANVLNDEFSSSGVQNNGSYATIPETGDGEYVEIKPEHEDTYLESSGNDRVNHAHMRPNNDNKRHILQPAATGRYEAESSNAEAEREQSLRSSQRLVLSGSWVAIIVAAVSFILWLNYRAYGNNGVKKTLLGNWPRRLKSVEFKHDVNFINVTHQIGYINILSVFDNKILIGEKEASSVYICYNTTGNNCTTKTVEKPWDYKWHFAVNDDAPDKNKYVLCEAVIISESRIALILSQKSCSEEFSGDIFESGKHIVIESILSNESFTVYEYSQATSLSVSDRGTVITAADLLTITIVSDIDGKFQYTPVKLEGFTVQAVTVSKPDENSTDHNNTFGLSFVWVIKEDESSMLNTTYYQLAVYKIHKNITDSSSYYAAVNETNVDTPSDLLITKRSVIVDDGHGNMLLFNPDQRDTQVLHWFWMDTDCIGHYGGELLSSDNIDYFYSVAVDTDNAILYVGHYQYVSVYSLLYRRY